MNDEKLLELAAKAAWITLTPVEIKDVTKQGDDRFIGYQTDPDQWPRGWFDPRHDNSDAFQLAARLKLQVAFGTFNDYEASAYEFGKPAVHVVNTDVEAAAREAIFLMAVEIGKEMK
jgi:hypothetical protein